MTQGAPLESNMITALQDVLTDCCVELMAAYGIEVQAEGQRFSDAPTPKVAAAIDIHGTQLDGTVMLVATRGILVATNSALDGTDPPSDTDLFDLSLELVNQVAGRLKTKLRSRGLSFQVDLPRIISLKPSNTKANIIQQRLVSSFGSVAGFVDIALAPDLILDDEVDDGLPKEGDVILF